MPSEKPGLRNIRNIALSNNEQLASLYRQSLAILDVQKSIRTELGSPLEQHLHVASLCDNSITLFTDSQAWATKLRFHTAEIVRITRKTSGFTRLKTVRIRVSPALLDNTESWQPVYISPVTSRLLANVAGNFTDNALRSVLLKLSRNTRKPPDTT